MYNTAPSVGLLEIHIDCCNNDLSTKRTFCTLSAHFLQHIK